MRNWYKSLLLITAAMLVITGAIFMSSRLPNSKMARKANHLANITASVQAQPDPVQAQPDPVQAQPDPVQSLFAPVQTQYYDDISQLDSYLDHVTDVDAQYVRAMRDLLESTVRKGYSVAWPYEGDARRIGIKILNPAAGDQKVVAPVWRGFCLVRSGIGLADGDPHNLNNPRNCSVVAYDASGNMLAIANIDLDISPDKSFFTPEEARLAVIQRQAIEDANISMEPAIQHAVLVQIVRLILMVKAQKHGDMDYTPGYLLAQKIVEKTQSKLLKHIKFTYSHGDSRHCMVNITNIDDHNSIVVEACQNKYSGDWDADFTKYGLGNGLPGEPGRPQMMLTP